MKAQIIWRFFSLLLGVATPTIILLFFHSPLKRSIILGQYCDKKEINALQININEERLSYIYDLFDPSMSPSQYNDLINFICRQDNADSKNIKIKIEDLCIQKFIKTNNLYPKNNLDLLQPYQERNNSNTELLLYGFVVILCILAFFFACISAQKKLHSSTDPQQLKNLKNIDYLLLLFLFIVLMVVFISFYWPNFEILDVKIAHILWLGCGSFFYYICTQVANRLLFP